ncbi:hypothetical protein HPB52_021849 [Rhipicephalus sanguineus]|uniref:Protein inscuteable homologue C-terminal domain-containing protein n=1 Tax=Rhipicephalus sanguineus TaxID=34632 RepID=A0A9D4PIN8_RHISA|nr:hypothetical protein HPB52_021849 [Rhipicephalus sanguineus]
MGRGGIDTSASGRSHDVIKLNLDTSLDNLDLFHKSVLPYQISKVSPRIGRTLPREEVRQDDWLSHSIEQVCRKTLYKNVQYRTINMSSEVGSEKDVCFVEKDKLAEKSKIDTPGSTPVPPAAGIPNNKATCMKTPENARIAPPKTPKTSTPKSASSFMKRCRRGSSFRLLRSSSEKKNVRFASTEDLAAEERHSPSLVPSSESRVKAEEALESMYATVSPIVPKNLKDVCRRLPFADEEAMTPVKKPETSECSFLNPAILPQNSPLGHYLQWIVEQSGLSSVPSVRQWLNSVRLSVENECLSALQSKSLTKDPALAAVLAVGDAHDAITSLQDRVDSVMATVTHLTRRLEQGLWIKFCSSTPGLSSEVNDLLRDYKAVIHGSSPYSRKVESHLYRLLQDLREIGARPNRKPTDPESIKSLLTDIKNTVRTLSNSLILKELEKIVKMSGENRALSCARRSVAALSSLGETGPDMCDLITRVGGIRALLSIAQDVQLRPLKCVAIRALTIVCGHSVAIRQLEQAGGIDFIERTLRDACQQERCEAVGLLAQVTAPWVDCTGGTLKHMSRHMDSLVSSLTGMIEQASSGDVFLLSAAALANLSFLDRVALECIHRNKSVRALMLATRQKDLACSIFAKDQVSTILANVSGGTHYHADIIESGALTQLVCYLQLRPSSLHSSGEVDACERVLQKSAIALARLCVQRLVRLCKEPKERNSSNSVLVACLAALRKIATSSGHKDLKDIGATELVKDHLWNSFKQYSVAHESYV